jgi:N-methyl-L-tryptophan oxidase
MPTTNTYEVIVIGAGSMGISAGYRLASKGIRTLLLDAFDPPHHKGSHHGEPRLLRHAYSGGPAYIRLAIEADRLWQQLEEESGDKLLERSGVLNMAERTLGRFDERVMDAEQAGIRLERLDAAEIRCRWPGVHVPETFEAMYEPDAGYLHSERCVAAYRRLALVKGATLLPHQLVEHIQPDGSGYLVMTRDGDFRADRLILSAGAWFQTLQSFVQLPVRAVRKTVGWFQAESAMFDAGSFPGFTIGTVSGTYYGFPSINGAGVKLGRHDGGMPWHPGEEFMPFGALARDEGDLRRTLEIYLPQAAGALLRGAVCKYELSPDQQFIIDWHPQHEGVLLAGGFSGHGFKFASAIGAMLAELISGDIEKADISPFALSRFHTVS